jgi:hypothetical protein
VESFIGVDRRASAVPWLVLLFSSASIGGFKVFLGAYGGRRGILSHPGGRRPRFFGILAPFGNIIPDPHGGT